MSNGLVSKLEKLSATELSDLVYSKELSAVEIINYFADRIDSRNSSINAFVYTKIEEALLAAKSVDKKIQNKEYAGIFAGVPFALKDFLPSKEGWTNTHGGVKSLTEIDPYSSIFCKAMENAGAIAIGKTNAPAFGFRGITDNKLYGPTSTPFNIQYNAGGSSGGSASAVADGLVPIAEGGDAGGSIRIPAAWCNCVGFKASAGFIPNINRPDAFSATHPFCTPGGLTKTVKDTACVLTLMTGYNKADPYSYKGIYPNFLNALYEPFSGLKIAATYDFGIFEVESEIKEKFDKAIKALEDAGIQVDYITNKLPRSAYEYAEIWDRAISIDSTLDILRKKQNGFDLIKDHADELSPEFIYWYEKTAQSNIFDYSDWNVAKTEIYDFHRQIFDKYDLLLSPVTNNLPVLNSSDKNTKGPESINNVKSEPLIGFAQTFLENIIGNPACSVPIGLSHNNLPIGIQIIGDKYNDYAVLKLAAIFEKILPWSSYYKICFDRKI